MSDGHSDALVFFGATGDLAYKKIFPALQAMVKRGRLDVPVIGVAKAGWGVDELRAPHATASSSTAAWMPRRSTRCAGCCAMSTAWARRHARPSGR
jgi:glucose-6-phosphate 1-dehydrogenase